MSLRLRPFLLATACLACALSAANSSFAQAPSSAATLDLTLTPTRASSGVADGVAVAYTYTPAPGSAAPFTLELNTLEPSLERNSDVVADLVASDKLGKLALKAPGRMEKDNGTYQRWTALRPASGPVNVSYRMHVAHNVTARRGPQYDLQAAGGGLSGGYIGFLMLPEAAGRVFDTRVQWHLSPGETAVSSYGEGSYEGRFTAEQLTGTLFLAGPVSTYTPAGQSRDAPLSVYALGVPPTQLKPAGEWTARAYAAEVKAFDLHDHRPYRFMIRSFAGSSNPSGRAAEHSFMLYVPLGADPGTDFLHNVVAHEMVHSLARYLENEQEAGDWYTEGAANYLAATLPNAAGLYTPAQYFDLVASESAGYYTNANRSLPNDKLPAIVWQGRNAWLLPYNRGAMYFADLDAKLKARGSNVTVLGLINEMSERIGAGEASDRHTWLDLLGKRVGPWAVDDWNDMMAGKVIFPADGAFGPCMHARRQDVRIFDLGFASPVRLNAGSTIGGLVAGSPAERAGLRNGDTLQAGTDITPAVRSLDETVTLHVIRDGKPLSFTFDPRGGSQPGMAWTSSCVGAPAI